MPLLHFPRQRAPCRRVPPPARHVARERSDERTVRCASRGDDTRTRASADEHVSVSTSVQTATEPRSRSNTTPSAEGASSIKMRPGDRWSSSARCRARGRREEHNNFTTRNSRSHSHVICEQGARTRLEATSRAASCPARHAADAEEQADAARLVSAEQSTEHLHHTAHRESRVYCAQPAFSPRRKPLRTTFKRFLRSPAQPWVIPMATQGQC